MTASERQAPTPRTAEEHPAGYGYRARFPSLRRWAPGEGGTVYVADEADGFYVVTDEGFFAEFLEDDFPCVHVYAFDRRADRDAYCESRYGALRRGRGGATDGAE
jgi:hypothetical protein